jgi:hypothetical protein
MNPSLSCTFNTGFRRDLLLRTGTRTFYAPLASTAHPLAVHYVYVLSYVGVVHYILL